jgi:flagellar hook-length control protein FliK
MSTVQISNPIVVPQANDLNSVQSGSAPVALGEFKSALQKEVAETNLNASALAGSEFEALQKSALEAEAKKKVIPGAEVAVAFATALPADPKTVLNTEKNIEKNTEQKFVPATLHAVLSTNQPVFSSGVPDSAKAVQKLTAQPVTQNQKTPVTLTPVNLTAAELIPAVSAHQQNKNLNPQSAAALLAATQNNEIKNSSVQNAVALEQGVASPLTPYSAQSDLDLETALKQLGIESDSVIDSSIGKNSRNLQKGKVSGTASGIDTHQFLNLREGLQQNKTSQPFSTQLGMDALKPQAAALNSGIASSAIPAKKLSAQSKEPSLQELMAGTTPIGEYQQKPVQFSPVIDAPVTQGSANKMILSHDAIQQMTSQLTLMNQNLKDGEIRIRLRPDHLGELSMQVKTVGNQVSIQFQAQDAGSKKIIEDSMSTLKEHLANSQLTLTHAKVDVQLSGSTNQNNQQMNFDSNLNMNLDPGQAGQSFGGQQGRESNDGSHRESNRESNRLMDVNESIFSVGRNSNRSQVRSGSSSSRLDLMAS